MTENTELEVTETVEEVEAPEHLSPIKVAEMANVRPQMVYNYIKKGYIDSIEVDGKKRVPRDGDKGYLAWIAKYTTRKAELTAKRQEQLEKELAGEA